MSDDHVLSPGTAPTPFSAAEIRAGCPAGRTVVVRVEDADGVHHRRSRFVAATAEGATYERAACDADGIVEGGVSVAPVTWHDLQRHASFPESATTRDEVTVDLPLGLEACWRYVVHEGEDVTTFWFAKRRPGMPVQVTSATRGVVTSTSVMVSDRVVPPSAG